MNASSIIPPLNAATVGAPVVQAVATACVRVCSTSDFDAKQQDEIACAFFLGAVAAVGALGFRWPTLEITRAAARVIGPAPYETVRGFLEPKKEAAAA